MDFGVFIRVPYQEQGATMIIRFTSVNYCLYIGYRRNLWAMLRRDRHYWT